MRSMPLRPTLLVLLAATLSCEPNQPLTAPIPGPLADLVPGSRPELGISQVYGGGGNAGATLRNDFIELYNLGAEPVDLSGWTVQYASAAGTSWQVTALGGTLQPGARGRSPRKDLGCDRRAVRQPAGCRGRE